MKKIYPLLLTAFIFSYTVFAQPVVGVLDQSFGTNGIVNVNLPQYSWAKPVDIKLQPDQKILVLSMMDSFNDSLGLNYSLRRLLPNGTPDSSFGINGIMVKKDERPFALALQPDGKILVSAAYFSPTVGQFDFALTRYNANGTVDNTFGNNGKIVTDFRTASSPSTNFSDMPVCVFLLPNGKILQCGYSGYFNGLTSFQSIVRYNANGTVDVTYGVNGQVMQPAVIYTSVVNAGSFPRIPMTMVLEDSQRVVASSVRGFTRFTSSGSIDSTFGVNGFTPVGGWEYCFSGVVQPDGKMVFAGYSYNNISLRRYNIDGTRDATFDTTALLTYPPYNVFDQVDGRLLLKPNGQFLLTLSTGVRIIVGLNANGTINTAYGRRGWIWLGFHVFYGAALQPDGKVILGGNPNTLGWTGGLVARLEDNALRYNYLTFDAFLDRNSNGVKDVGEWYFRNANATVTKLGGSTLNAASWGRYEALIDTGTYITQVFPTRPYYNVVPASHTTSNSTYFNEDTFSFAMQPIPGIKDVGISIMPFGPARPSTYTGYRLVLTNHGTESVSGTFSMTKDSKLTNPLANNATINGDTITWSYANLAPLRDTQVYVKALITGANIGDTLRCSAYAPAFTGEIYTTDNSASSVRIVTGAYDPNDKKENHAGRITLAQVNSGEYLTYTIRFQNTGNDTAFNVYIRDTMDNKLDWNSLQIVASSHNYNMTMNDGKCLFTFPFIMLVDSIKNEPKSHGYIVYKIKAKPTVQVGDIIKNTAAIYFDYNLPIITNTENTTVVAETFPLKLLSFIAKMQDKTNVLQWLTAQEVNVDKFEIERSGNGREFSKIGAVKAGSLNYSFADNKPLATTNYYRLKMIDKDGSFSYSPVRLISNNSSFTVAIYPNPAKDKLQIQITSDKPMALQMQVVSLDGKILISNSFTANEANTLRSINISSLQRGSYLLKVSSENKDEQVMKFEKL